MTQDSTPVEQLCAKMQGTGATWRCNRPAGYHIHDPKCPQWDAPGKGHHPFLAPTAVPVSDATREAEARGQFRLLYETDEQWLAETAAYRDAVEARVRASLPSNSDRLAGLEAALQWALDEGGWRLPYYAVDMPPEIETDGGVGSASVRGMSRAGWEEYWRRYPDARPVDEAESSASTTPKGDE